MSRIVAKPILSFSQALSEACNKLTDIKGRARRSEFWWFMLAFTIASFFLNLILGMTASFLTSQIISLVIWLFAYAVTARRLHDSGHSQLWVVVSWLTAAALTIYIVTSGLFEEMTSVNSNPEEVAKACSNLTFVSLTLISGITSLAIFIFCLMDSKVQPNKWGESPKYINEEDVTEIEFVTNETHSNVCLNKASLGSRFVASLLDIFICLGLSIPSGIFYFIGMATSYDYYGSTDYSDSVFFFFFAILFYAIPLVYSFIKDGLGEGQSWGKKVMDIKVVNLSDKSNCSKGTSALRTLIGCLILLIPFVGWIIEPIIVLATSDGRRLADKVAGTMVINIK